MNKKRVSKFMALILCALMAAGIFTGCQQPVKVDESGAAATQDYPVEVNGVTVSAKPTKVVVLSENIADVILAMGYETSLVAASEDCTQADFNTLTKVDKENVQAIIDMGADLVISDSFAQGQAESLNEAGITCVLIEKSKNREDFERMYSQVGSLLNGASAGYSGGISAAQKIFSSIDDLSRIIPKSDKVITGCYIFDTDGNGVTGDMLASTIMTYAGITNVLKGSKDGKYDFENLKVTNPDYIFCPVGMKDKITSDANFKKMSAVQNDKVYEIDEKYIILEGRSVITGATQMAGIAYPELLEESEASATMSEPESTPEPTVDPAQTEAAAAKIKEEAAKYTELKSGDNSDDVLKMQEKLSDLGYLTVEYDGMYGEVTGQAVKDFQTKNGLTATGTADAMTLATLYSDQAKTNKESDAVSSEVSTTESSKTESSKEESSKTESSKAESSKTESSAA